MLVVLLLLILWPLAEVYVAVLVAQAIGALEMLALVGAVSVGGLFALRSQSRTAWVRFNQALQERRLPNREVGDGLLGFSGGLLLVLPGLISGAIGLLLILPPTKAVARGLMAFLVARRYRLSGSAATWTYATYTSRGGTSYDVTGSAEEVVENAQGEVVEEIDGEAANDAPQRKDDPPGPLPPP